MNENLLEAKYDVTKKSRIKKFYESNKISIFATRLVLIISIAAFIFYSQSSERKKILLADNYVQAKMHLKNMEKREAKNILKKIIFANENPYSTLSLFLILNENLIDDQKELLKFDY